MNAMAISAALLPRSSGGKLRRRTLLPPGEPVVVPPGVPLVWDARLALARVWQCYRRWIQAPTLLEGYRWRSEPMPAVVKELARDCTINIGPWPGRVVTRCPRCGSEVYLLRVLDDGWGCRHCDGQRWRQLEVSLGAYAMGLRIQLGGRPMVRRWTRLVRALAALASRARTGDDLLLLAVGGDLIRYSPHWSRRRWVVGTLRHAWGSTYIGALIDSLLHPAAFLERFADP